MHKLHKSLSIDDKSDARPMTLPRHSVICNMGDTPIGIWRILEGYVAIRTFSRDGKGCMMRLASEGQLIGVKSLSNRESRTTLAEALTLVRLKFYPEKAVIRARRLDSEFDREIERSLSVSLSATESRLQSMMTLTSTARLLDFFGDMGIRQGRDTSEGFTVFLPFPYKDIADIIGVTPEGISRLFRKLRGEGIIRFQNRSVLDVSAHWRDLKEIEDRKPATASSRGIRRR